MPDVTLMLGPVAFSSFELPDKINIGGKQRLAIHRMTDGRRVIDCLGRDDSDLIFRGVFTGPDATVRARTLDIMRVVGDPLPLTWDVFFYTVILNQFDAEYHSPSWIPYRISCFVVQDDASDLITPTVSLLSSVQTDVGTAAEDSSELQLDFTGVQSLLAVQGATTKGSAAYCAAQAGLVAMQSTIAASTAASEVRFENGLSASDVSTGKAISSLSTTADALGKLGMLAMAAAYTGRALCNLTSAST